MTEVGKKTLGLAVASLICGLFFIIPLLGMLLSLAALILGIIALVKISNNKDTLKGKGLAITGIVLGLIGLVIVPILALMVAIAVPNALRARITANEAFAKATLISISSAAKTYREVNNGKYPMGEYDLTNSQPPYLTKSYANQPIHGYEFKLDFQSDGYNFIAAPTRCGTSGKRIFWIAEDGVITEKDCKQF
ncbi:MAG: DUF4190 domain-containing protein [Candidatus Omnitrophica bacterium]|nr:DUF4190 domain-containing protein [Candidatus Omnitrophota bacterium]